MKELYHTQGYPQYARSGPVGHTEDQKTIKRLCAIPDDDISMADHIELSNKLREMLSSGQYKVVLK